MERTSLVITRDASLSVHFIFLTHKSNKSPSDLYEEITFGSSGKEDIRHHVRIQTLTSPNSSRSDSDAYFAQLAFFGKRKRKTFEFGLTSHCSLSRQTGLNVVLPIVFVVQLANEKHQASNIFLFQPCEFTTHLAIKFNSTQLKANCSRKQIKCILCFL